MAGTETRPGGMALWGYGAALVAAVLAVTLARLWPAITAGEVITFGWNWAPSLGIGLSFMVDGLSLIFGLLITGIGALIFLYATGYMGGHGHFGRFVLFLFSFMLSMLGLVLARDLITLFLFWELTSITSYLLIGFNHADPAARRNALQAMLVTGAGGLALLAGFVLIGQATGSYDLIEIISGPALTGHTLYLGIFWLVIAGAFTKSAQFPFHFWLPNAMAAPTPVSAYLHSATMVKAGVYLLARLHPALGGTEVWTVTLTTAGLITAVWASLQALRQSDLKQALAYTTLMALGTITCLLAGDSAYALTAAVTFLIVHSLYKATLFMVVGAIDHGTGTREIAALGGLRQAMPVTATAALIAGAAMAGLPPFLGWIGKELIYASATHAFAMPLVVVGALAANALMFAVAGVVALRPFWGTVKATPHAPHEAPWQMLAGPVILSALGLIAGIIAGPALSGLIGAAVTGSLQADHAAGLHLWGGVNLPLALSLATFALGAVLYLAAPRFRQGIGAALGRLPAWDSGWDRFLDAFRAFAGGLTALIQNGKASHYLTATFVVAFTALALSLWYWNPAVAFDLAAPPVVWVIAAFTLAGAGLAMGTASRIAVITGISTVGIGVALIFIYFGAPDVATTQLMVETLSAVMLGIAALKLPALKDVRRPSTRVIHALIAGGMGLCVTVIVLAIQAHPLDRFITTFFEENSYSAAHGMNIVNVILVDFRAFDTFGELIVVFLAGIGAYALLKRRNKGERT